MTHKFGFFLALSLWCGLLYGGINDRQDSFTVGPNRATLEDSVDYLLHLASVNLDRYPQRAFTNASIAKHISSQMKWSNKQAMACKYMGEAKIELEDYYQAKKYLIDAIDYFTEETPKILGDCYYLLAETNYYLAEYKEANKNYRSAIALYEKTGDRRRVANALQNIGLLYHELNDLEKASKYYNESMVINNELENDTNIAGLYQNMGLIHYRNNDFIKALDFFEKSIRIYQELADTQNIATTFSNIGLIQLQQQYYKEAFNSFKKSYNLFQITGYRLGKMWARHNMGIANVWLQEYKTAEKYLNESLTQAYSLHNPEGVMSNLNALSDLMAQKGNYEQAFYYYLDYTELRDSIQLLESRGKIAELEALYNLEAQEKKINQSIAALKKHKAQRIGFIVLLAIVTITSVFIYIAYRKKRHAEVEIYSDKLTLENVLEEKNKELEAQIMERKIAEESDKLKSAFLANMSHELRTPMNAIIAFSNFLREPDLPEKKREEYLDHIASAGDNLLHLIDDIIDIAKLEAKQLKISIGPVNISRMLRELKRVFQKIKAKSNYKADLVLSIDPHNDFIINTDVLRIKQILNNLIENAFKYTPRGIIEFGVKHTGEGMLFFVKDNGVGISPEKQDKIFDRFSQIDSELNRKYGGTGLGLAISKNLAELLGGKIWVESEPDKGSSFYVLIPANDLRMVEVSGPNISKVNKLVNEKNYNWAKKTILVAEDEELNYKVLNSCLSKTNARILRATNGEKAVEMCQQEKIDLVLMDIQMPVMDGYEATSKIKASNISVPIIAQTPYALANEKERCIDAGCDDYITKPLDLDQLLSLINKYLA